MKLSKISILVLLIARTGFAMQNPLALQLEDHPRSIICFLHHYGHANFRDVDERGVYYTGIYADDGDVTFVMPWAKVKEVLGKAVKDLSQFDISKEDTGLKKEYREVLRYVQRMHDTQHYTDWLSYVDQNRQKYRAAMASGDASRVKEALKLDLWPPHID